MIGWDVPLNILQLLKGLEKSYGEAEKQPLYCDSFNLYIARVPVESGTQSGILHKKANTFDVSTRRCTITSVVITYIHHQITSLQYSIKGGAQGTR